MHRALTATMRQVRLSSFGSSNVGCDVVTKLLLCCRSRTQERGFRSLLKQQHQACSSGSLVGRRKIKVQRVHLINYCPRPVDAYIRTSSTLRTHHDTAQAPNSTERLAELSRVRDLISALSTTNSKLEKESILRQYGDLKGLLTFLFDPHVRMHVRPTTLKKYLANLEISEDGPSMSAVQDIHYTSLSDIGLLDLFRTVSDRERTGNDALHFLASFLEAKGILRQHHCDASDGNLSLLEVFYRCLNRNLKVGVSESIVRAAFNEDVLLSSPTPDQAAPPLRSLSAYSPFGVALGRPIEKEELHELFEQDQEGEVDGAPRHTQPAWYVSRKLDGVRCVVQVELHHKQHEDAWSVVGMKTLSRTGRPFHTLDKLKAALKSHIEQSLVVRKVLQDARERGQQLGPSQDDATTARIFLDGEVCMLVPESTRADERPPHQERATDDGVSFVEDFQAIVGPIKRKEFTVDNPAYFLFDMLTFSEFYHWRTESDKHKTFAARTQRLEQFVSRTDVCCASDVDDKLTRIRHVRQTQVTSVAEVEQWVERAAQNGWEGLILRRDVAYEGKRTSSIRKIKQNIEAEYAVHDVEVAEMRLPVGQRYAQRRALASVIIVHKGTKVNIGSGFTAEQRIRYAERPDLIVGKQITVAYFGESFTANEKVSLRFPRIKAIWEEGERDV